MSSGFIPHLLSTTSRSTTSRRTLPRVVLRVVVILATRLLGLFLLTHYEKIGRVDAHELTRPDPGTAPALGERRTQVLAALRGANAPLTVGAVAGQVGLHANTARFHLDA